jgi:hypothetical protein
MMNAAEICKISGHTVTHIGLSDASFMHRLEIRMHYA